MFNLSHQAIKKGLKTIVRDYLLPVGSLGVSTAALLSVVACTPSIQGFEKVEVETPQSIEAGKPFTVKVVAKTANGLVAKSVIADVKISSKDPQASQNRGPAALFGKPVMASVSMGETSGGEAAAEVAFKAAGDQTLVIDFEPKGGQPTTVTQTVSVTPSAPHSFSVVHVPVFPAGTFSPVVYAYDYYGNLITDVQGSVTLRAYTDALCSVAATGSSLDAVETVSFVKGAAAFPKITYQLTDSVYLEVVAESGAVKSAAKHCGKSVSAGTSVAHSASVSLPTWNTTVSGISPVASPFQGGVTVTVTGSNFRTGATVTLGGVACASTSVTNTQITCITGSGYASYPGVEDQPVDVKVSNQDGTSATLSLAFTYYIPRTCKTIYDRGNAGGNGVYKIRPRNSDPEAGVDARCNMNDGGWTLVAREAATQSGNLRYLGTDGLVGSETALANQTANGVLGSRFEAAASGTGSRLYSNIQITSGGDATQFSLSSASQAFFENTRDLDIEIVNLSTTNSNLDSWVSTAGGVKFCRAAYTGHAAWDSSTADGSTLNLAAAPNPTYSISNAWTSIGYAQTAWGIKPIDDQYYGRYVPGTHTQDVTNNNPAVNSTSLSPASGAYGPVATGSTAACSGNVTGVPNYATSHWVWTSTAIACHPGALGISGGCGVGEIGQTNWYCWSFWVTGIPWLGDCVGAGGYNHCDTYYNVYRWTIPNTTLTHTQYLDNGSGGTGGGGCTSGAGYGRGLFYGGVTGGGFLGVSDNGQSKAPVATTSETLIWIR